MVYLTPRQCTLFQFFHNDRTRLLPPYAARSMFEEQDAALALAHASSFCGDTGACVLSDALKNVTGIRYPFVAYS